MFKKLLGAIALAIMIPMSMVSAQSNTIEVTAGASNVANETAFTSAVEYKRQLNDRFQFKDTVSFSRVDSDRQAMANRSILRAFLTDNIFVGGGVTVGKAKFQDVVLNPTVEAGVLFNVDRFSIEPRVQLDTPDLLSDNSARSLGAQLKAKVRLTDNFGLVGVGGVRSTRFDNRFFTEGLENSQKFALGGVYFTF